MSEVESGIEYRKDGSDYLIAGDTDAGDSPFGCKKDGADLAIKVVLKDDANASDIHCKVVGEEKAWKLVEELYYFGVTITPKYVGTDPGDVAKTGTFTIAVQAYNYGTGEMPEPVEGVRYVNKKAGTESWWWYAAGNEYRKETINPNCVPPETWEIEVVGAAWANLYHGNFISGGYVLYKGESVFDTFTFVEGGGGHTSESGIYIKAVVTGDLSNDHVFLIIKVSN